MIIMETERLIIRRFLPEDWKDLYEYLSIPEVVFYEPYEVYTEEDCKKAALKRYEAKEKSSFFAVCLKENNKMIGNLYFSQEDPVDFMTFEIGYVFNPHYYGNGYATEACKRILKYAFEELNAHRIIAGANVNNSASWKLLERLSMRRESHKLQNAFFKRTEDGKPIWHDSYHYAILSHEWQSKKE